MKLRAAAVAASMVVGLAVLPDGGPAAASLPPIRILTLGDSITSLCPTGGYCGPLGALLTATGQPYTFINRASGGTACDYTASNINSWLTTDHPDLVLLNCGTNNVPQNQAMKDALGTQWRTIVEAVHVYGAKLAVSFIGYSNPDNISQFHANLPTYEANANDTIYVNMQYYQPYGWFSGVADFQSMPGDLDYLLADGIHPVALGYKTMAAVWYRSLRVAMGWDDVVPSPCGMWGHRPAYGPPSFTGCTSTS